MGRRCEDSYIRVRRPSRNMTKRLFTQFKRMLRLLTKLFHFSRPSYNHWNIWDQKNLAIRHLALVALKIANWMRKDGYPVLLFRSVIITHMYSFLILFIAIFPTISTAILSFSWIWKSELVRNIQVRNHIDSGTFVNNPLATPTRTRESHTTKLIFIGQCKHISMQCIYQCKQTSVCLIICIWSYTANSIKIVFPKV